MKHEKRAAAEGSFPKIRTETIGTIAPDLPPLKWSSLKYDFDEEDKINGKEAAYS